MTKSQWQAALVAAAIYLAITVVAIAQSRGEGPTGEQTVELFAAIEAGEITAEVIPRNAERLTLIVTNETDRPLRIDLPGAALAQFFPQPGQQQNNNRQNNSPQGLGFGFQAGQNVGQQGRGNGFGQQRFQGAQFAVPPGATIRARIDCVCLEHGKPDPTPRQPYRLLPIEEFSADRRLAALLELASYGNYTQREVQIATWHLTDGIAWEEFEEAQIEHLNGFHEEAYSAAEVAHARELFGSLSEEMLPTAEPESTSPGEVAQRETAAE